MGEELTGRTLLGKYRIESLLGEGGMGSVWRAEHVRTGRKVAIKVLAEQFLANTGVVQRFGREARAASAIDHPGIVEVLDLDQTEDGSPFLVMELLPGYSLGARIAAKGKLPIDETLGIMEQLLDALQAAHDHGVVHRDLKPDNVFVVPRKRGVNTVKILDFGISQKADERVQQLTVAGTVLGTPHYMAPEQAMGDIDVDARADIYAAGVLMYECLVGDVPFDATNYNALIHVILNDAPASPRQRGADVGLEVERVLLRCLSKEKTARPDTARALSRLLREAHTRDSLKKPTGTIASSPPPPPDRAAPSPLPPVSGGGGVAVAAAPAPVEVGELVISRSSHRMKKVKPVTSIAPPHDEPDALDPLNVALDGNEKLELDTSVIHSTRPPRRSLSPSSSSISTSGMRAPVSGSFRPPAQAREKSPLLWYFVGALVVFSLVILAFRFVMRSDDTLHVGGGGGGTAPDPSPTGEGPAEPVSADGRVVIELTQLPPGAEVKLDGLPAGSLPLRLRRDTAHTLDISAPGYVSRQIAFTADADKRLSARLEPHVGMP